jgi:hypothetical protein
MRFSPVFFKEKNSPHPGRILKILFKNLAQPIESKFNSSGGRVTVEPASNSSPAIDFEVLFETSLGYESKDKMLP